MSPDLVLTPSEFVDVFNQTIDYAYPRVVVEGEISSFRVAKNRWVYFDIKDATATVRCFGTVYMLPGPLEDGMMVQIVCTPRLHPQFNFSLQLQSIVPKGEGAISKAAELVYKKLESEGLFLPERKRPIPFAPEHIALITSAGSAAYADFTKITRERWPLLSIDVYDSLVQGSDAPAQLVSRITQVNQSPTPYDAVVVVRGGGSAEDLAAFNDERVVRALAASRVPTVVAIGHEVDESLAELVADMRASTPSNAAELMTPHFEDEQHRIGAMRARLDSALSVAKTDAQHFIVTSRNHLDGAMRQILLLERARLDTIAGRLSLLHPKEVLKRGYAMIRLDGSVITHRSGLSAGDEVAILMQDGEAKAKIL